MATDWIRKDKAAWVHGLKRKTAQVHGEYFHKHILAVIRASFGEIPHAATTTEAEEKLGVPPSQYWYLGRADDLYGEVVFLCEANTTGSDAHVEGMCPFDSGGMWSGLIHTNPPTDPRSVERREMFWRCNLPLTDWARVFADYLKLCYSDPERYVRGQPPSNIPPDHPVVCTQPPNHPRAWTWETRVASDQADSKVRARHGYMTKARKDEILNWMEEQPWDIFIEVLPWVENEVDTPPAGRSSAVSPVELASRLLESI